MKNPSKEVTEDLEIHLQEITWSNKSGRLMASFTEVRFDFSMNEDDPMFEDLFPKGEYNHHDADGLTVIMIDDYYNMHWLVKDSQGLIHHRVVFVKNIIENISERKLNGWK